MLYQQKGIKKLNNNNNLKLLKYSELFYGHDAITYFKNHTNK